MKAPLSFASVLFLYYMHTFWKSWFCFSITYIFIFSCFYVPEKRGNWGFKFRWETKQNGGLACSCLVVLFSSDVIHSNWDFITSTQVWKQYWIYQLQSPGIVTRVCFCLPLTAIHTAPDIFWPSEFTQSFISPPCKSLVCRTQYNPVFKRKKNRMNMRFWTVIPNGSQTFIICLLPHQEVGEKLVSSVFFVPAFLKPLWLLHADAAHKIRV